MLYRVMRNSSSRSGREELRKDRRRIKPKRTVVLARKIRMIRVAGFGMSAYLLSNDSRDLHP
jgi:hypothetical protein